MTEIESLNKKIDDLSKNVQNWLQRLKDEVLKMPKMTEIVVRRREAKGFPLQGVKMQQKLEQRERLFWLGKQMKIERIPKNGLISLNV